MVGKSHIYCTSIVTEKKKKDIVHPFNRYPILKRWYRNHRLPQDLKKYVIDDSDFLIIKRVLIPFCAFLYFVVSVYAVDVLPAESDADDEGAVVHIDIVARAGIGIFGLPAFAPPVKS